MRPAVLKKIYTTWALGEASDPRSGSIYGPRREIEGEHQVFWTRIRRRALPIRPERKSRMKRYLLKTLLFTIFPMPLLAAPELELDFSARTSQGSYGEVRVRGKASIKVKDLNRVRYQYKIRRQVTAVAAPDVLKILPFLPITIAGPVTYKARNPEATSAIQAESAQRRHCGARSKNYALVPQSQ